MNVLLLSMPDSFEHMPAVAIRMPNGETEANGCAIVEDVDCETTEADHLGEAIDDVRDILEGVSESVGPRHVGLSKTGQIGSDEAKSV